MKSATEIMLHNQAAEAKAAYLSLLRLAKEAVAEGLYGKVRTQTLLMLQAAVKRCESWHSTLPQLGEEKNG